ncbi:hypothetical protein KW791_00660 [Candidatus Parcubacteria bacterium]|nr:hypothetical protein [Candidatus Parcubacteria bacterium]
MVMGMSERTRKVRVKAQYVVKSYGSLIHIWEPVFQSNYYYVIAPNYAGYCQVIKHHFDIDVSEEKQHEPLGHTTCYAQESGTLIFIWTREHSPDVIAHECFHAVSFELRARGVRLAEDSDELYAYMIQFLMKSILTNLPKRRKVR